MVTIAGARPQCVKAAPVSRVLGQNGNDCGMRVDPKDPQAIAEAMDHLVTNPEEAWQMGKNGRAAVEREFSWESQSERLLSLYESIVPEVVS
jgi:glycosyltransferase involved in cell wall biosynthesis